VVLTRGEEKWDPWTKSDPQWGPPTEGFCLTQGRFYNTIRYKVHASHWLMQLSVCQNHYLKKLKRSLQTKIVFLSLIGDLSSTVDSCSMQSIWYSRVCSNGAFDVIVSKKKNLKDLVCPQECEQLFVGAIL